MEARIWQQPDDTKQNGPGLTRVKDGLLLTRTMVFCVRVVKLTTSLAVIVAMALAGCATRPGPEQLTPVTTPATVKRVQLFVVTNRDLEPSSGSNGSERGTLGFETFTVGVAAKPVAGKSATDISSRGRDLAKDFITLERRRLDEAAFGGHVAEQSGSDPILLFVHGYNYTYQEAVFRLAEMSIDFRIKAIPVLFSWPSQGSIRGYVADRDGATYARDDLVQLLTMLGRSRPTRHIIVIGHSMGAWLVMESLRQLRLQGRDDLIKRLQVGLAAPDIDIDVFRAQMAVVGRLTPPLSVLVSQDDRALALSRRIAGGRPRLGAVAVDAPEIQDLAQQTGARIVDISDIPSAGRFNHDRFVVLAGLTSRTLQLAEHLEFAGAYIFDRSGAIVTAPFRRTAQVP